MSGSRILIVEDLLTTQQIYRAILEKAGHQVCTAVTYDQAASMVDSSIDLALVDVKLPNGASGVELLKYIRHHQPDCPVIMVSAFADKLNAIDSLRAGAVDYLEKPVDPEELLHVVQRWLSCRFLKQESARLQDSSAMYEALQESEAKYKRMVESSPAIIYEFSEKRGGIYYSPQAAEILGYTLEHLYANPFLWNQSIHPDDGQAVAQAIKDFKERGAFDVTYRIRDAHDNWLWFHDRSIHRREEHGEVIINGLAEDITRRKLAEKALQEGENKFRSMFDNANDAIYLIDPETTRILDCNRKASEMLGFSIDELKALSAKDLHPQDDQVILREKLKEFIENGRAVISETHHTAKDGRIVPVEINVSVIEFGGRKLNLGIARDITERKAQEAKIRRLTQLYAAVSECNQAIVHCTSEDELFPQICRDAVEFGDMKMAWIGMVDQTSKRMIPVASFGIGTEYLDNILVTVDAVDPHGRGPVGTAIRENRPYWCQDFQRDPVTAPWHERAASIGWGAIAALPLHRGGIPIGAFTLYATESNVFDADTRILLSEMAEDISFALDNFNRERARKQAEQALRASEQNLLDAQRVGRIGSYIAGIAADAWTSSATMDEILGIGADFPRTKAGWKSLIHPDHGDEMRSFLYALIREHQPVECEFRMLRANDGAERWVVVHGRTVFDNDGNPLHVTGTIQDITERKQAESQLKLASKVFEQSGEGFLITDAACNIIMVNHAFTVLTGYSEEEVLGQNPRILSSGHQDREFYREMWDSINSNGYWQGELLDRRKDGSLYSKRLSISRVLDAQGGVSHYVGIFNDITQHKQDEERIQRLAHFDALTGLPNRVLLADRISHALSSAQRSQKPLAVLFLDLDHFKNVNDSLGHRIGDQLLIQVAQRLSSAIREEDTVSRLGGDEFILLLQDSDADGAAHVAEKMLALIAQPYLIEQHELSITPSIGIAMFPSDGEDFDTLSKRADAAMYRAKHDGRNNFRFFTTEMQAHSVRRLKLENALRHALERDQLSLHYQPQLSLSSGLIIGAEALLRWTSADFGQVSPAEFIPIAEDSGLILSIGEWVLRTAIRQLKSWMDSGIGAMVMAVNLSAVQFRNPKLPGMVAQILAEARLPPQYLELELTESVAMEDPLAAIAVMDSLHERGIRMSIDDFGTGYSSLSYLKRFRVYKLKIDQSFVRDISDDAEDRAIVNAIINLANSLSLKTIAEGVETEGQLKFLRDQGCGEIQGYHLSRPLPADQFEAFVRRRSQA